MIQKGGEGYRMGEKDTEGGKRINMGEKDIYSYAGPLAIPAKLYIFSLYKIQLIKEKMIYAWTLGKKLWR